MSHPNPTGNGCSLEDCHTNVFALTDLTGIQWRRLYTDTTAVDVLDDPVLQSYTRCLQSDILCVWRRIKRSPEQRITDNTHYAKELWIFWYGKEPANLGSVLAPELKVREEGSWDQILPYETRTLLFKAIHNLIERCLLSRGFVRLGKWFVQTSDGYTPLTTKSNHLSFCFNFFLHGDNTICASIEVKQHFPVVALHRHHLDYALTSQSNVNVILSPYGLNGTLTGQSYRAGDVDSAKILSEWNQYYKLNEPSMGPAGDGTTDDDHVPPLVEIVICGVRMKYPSQFVLIANTDQLSQAGSGPGPAPDIGDGGRMSYATSAPTASDIVSSRITEKVSQDFCLTTGTAKRSHESMSDDKPQVFWDMHESSAKVSCACSSRHKSKTKGSAGKHGKDKNDKSEKNNSRRSLTFHQRQSQTVVSYDTDIPVHRGTSSSIGGPLSQQQQPTPGDPSTFANTPTSNTTSVSVSNNNNNAVTLDRDRDGNNHSADSPISDPSPLDHSQSVPAQQDPLMPTLSPQPLVKDKDGVKPALSSIGLPSANAQQDYVSAAPFQNDLKPSDLLTKPRLQTSDISPTVKLPESTAKTKPVVNSWLQSQKSLVPGDVNCLKMPVLPFSAVESEELVTNALYDFTGLNSWFDFAAKRARMDLSQSDAVTLDPLSSTNPSLSRQKIPSPPPDPYEFADDTSVEPGGLRGYRNSRDDIFPRQHIARMEEDMKMRNSSESFAFDEKGAVNPLGSPPTPGSKQFMSVAQLKPSTTDLEHMFESSDSDNDDNISSPNMTSLDDIDGIRANKKKQKLVPSGTIGAAELTRMYPTPPSLENNHTVHSPGMTTDLPPDTTALGRTMQKYERIYTTDDPAKEVFKPAKVFQHLNSTKYAPVELPSQSLSPLPSPPHYKTMWPYHVPLHEKMPLTPHNHSNYLNVPSVENALSVGRYPSGGHSDTSPYPGSIHQQQRTPMSYELQSPASNASSYLNKNLNSVDNHGTNIQTPEAHALVINVMLSDSIHNLFRDHNFDSCNVCVCNMSILGSDMGLYLPDPTGISDTESLCLCGFSAVMNRKHAQNSGLFHEDEFDITANEIADRRRPSLLNLEPATTKKEHPTELSDTEKTTQEIMRLLVTNFCLSIPSGSIMLQMNKLATASATASSTPYINYLLVKDGNEAAYSALEQGRQAAEHCTPSRPDDYQMKMSLLHKWPFLQAGSQRVPLNSQDVIWLLRSLLPLLQDAIQKKRMAKVWESSYQVSGPLSWKDFHNFAGRGNAESCQPQPIPSFLVGHDKDWLSLSPYTLQHWDKLMLEPCGKQRDVTYVVVCPDNDYILDNVKRFFHELSTVYEMCRLGRHRPLPKKLRDGILRVGDKTRELLSNPVDEWFTQINESPISAKLKLYALACRYHLGPILSQQTLDKSLFESGAPKNTMYRSQPEPSPKPPQTPDNPSSQSSTDENKENTHENTNQRDSFDADSDESDVPALVVYLVDPFTYGSDWNNADRVSMIGLLQCYHHMVRNLPDHIQPHINLQIIPLQMVVDQPKTNTEVQQMKSLAFSVFAMCRWNISQSIIGRSLTSFGPAAAAEMLLKKQEVEKNGSTLKLYSPPFILAPITTKQMQLAETCGEKLERSNVVFCAYCLSDDQRWLIAALTDERGELLETCMINIDIPKRNQRRNIVARKHGLKKLWDFILGVISMTCRSCRLVVGRFGRLGHGELKGWSGLLSRDNLRRTNKRMRDTCRQCGISPTSDTPGILSGCMVSMEAQPTFRVMPDSLNKEEYMSSNCPLQTPRDASCTHILVFPTSATTSAQASAAEQMPLDDLFTISSDVVGNDDDILNEYGLFTESLIGWNSSPTASPTGSPGGHNGVISTGSPGLDHAGQHSPKAGPATAAAPIDPQDLPSNLSQQPLAMGYYVSTAQTSHYTSPATPTNLTPHPQAAAAAPIDPQDLPSNLSQQPLAMGYYVSTAQTGPLPRWFTSSTPDIENSCPAIFKCALHIRTSLQQMDEFMSANQTPRNNHPLDSSLTCDVLRYVLENYNALSWLTMDPVLNDRRSCLPIHIAVLLQMYHSLNSFL